MGSSVDVAGDVNPIAQLVADHFDAVVAAMGVVTVAFLTLLGTILTLLVQTRSHAKRADEQVSNNHVDEDGNPINLREESDERHAENGAKLDAALSELKGVRSELTQTRADVGGMRSDIRQLYRQDADMSERITDLDNTIPKGHPVWQSTPQRTPPTPATDRSAPSHKASPWTS